MMRLCFCLLVISSIAVASAYKSYLPPDDDDELSLFRYHGSCPEAEEIIHNKVAEWVKKDSTLGPALIRLHFHDCSCRGCDGSILLNHPGSEREANASKTLRGFEVIDDIKAAIEKKCPKTVSCADILSAAARDATVRAGGPYWQVPYGRKDGRVSLAMEAEMIPMGHESVTEMVEFFQSLGLNILDLVTLLGAHTIGRSSCGSLQHRLYDYNGTRMPDPSINPMYLNYLRRKCRWASEYVNLDAITPNKFDAQYYKNIQNKMGLLKTDQILHIDSRTAPLLNALASQEHVFSHQFAASMLKFGNIQDHRSVDDGEIRLVCSKVNAQVRDKA